MRRTLLSLVLAVGLALGATACASPRETLVLDSSTVIIDVRTADEFASGHLDGALNIDVQEATFDTLVSELDPDASYIVYCRSGNRSGVAIDRMTELGFTDLTNGGGVENASQLTGLAIIAGP
jgi:phage shock protein E